MSEEFPASGKGRSFRDIPSTSSSTRVIAPPPAFVPFPPTRSSTTFDRPMPGVALQSASLAPPFYERPTTGATYSAHAYQTTPTLPPLSGLQTPQLQQQRSTALSTSSASSALSAPLPGQTTSKPTNQDSPQGSTKTGRKSKAHVASACFNCKRAHLSCDDQRPCARCVASGKQDTCYDVQHKKRGRPRLREESDFKIERMTAEPGRPTSSLIGAANYASARPIAATRPRRSDSFRSHPSHSSDGSIGMAASPMYPYPHPTSAMRSTFEHPQAAHRPPSPTGPPFFEIPTAVLDIDFVILRANRLFWQVLFRGQELVGRNMGDIVTPADGESFLTIRNRLRRERDAHSPASETSMLQAGSDPIQGIRDVDVEQFTHGFHDRTYVWTQVGAGDQSFPARVRLARASSYFVVITLPSFRPVESRASTYRTSQTFHRPHLSHTQSYSHPESYSAPTSHTPQASHALPPVGYQSTHHQHQYPQTYAAVARYPAPQSQPPPPPPPPPPPASAPGSMPSVSRSFPPPYSQPTYHDRSNYRPTTPRVSEPTPDHGPAGDVSRRPSLADSAASSASGAVRLPPILASPLRDSRPTTQLRPLDHRNFEGESSEIRPPPPPASTSSIPTSEQAQPPHSRAPYTPQQPQTYAQVLSRQYDPQSAAQQRPMQQMTPSAPPPPPPPPQHQSQYHHHQQRPQSQQQQTSYAPSGAERRTRERTATEAEDDEQDRPRKRARRMGIDDVLH